MARISYMELIKRYYLTVRLIGCVADSGTNRLLRYQKDMGTNATNDKCVAACSASGYQLAGVENGTECWCDNNFQYLPTQKPSSDCAFPCSGNAYSTCGGNSTLTVYRNNTIAGWSRFSEGS